MLKNHIYLAVFAFVIIAAGAAYYVSESKRYGPMKMTKANASEIHEILSDNVDEVIRQIGLDNVDVSLPVDGKGARIMVRVEKGKARDVPESIVVNHNSQNFEILLEASETYERYEAQ